VLQTAAQSGGTSDVTASATVTIDKASPRLSYAALSRVELLQPRCPTQPWMPNFVWVHFPVLNQGPFLSDVNGESTIKDARLASLSSGAVRYSTSVPTLLNFSGNPVYSDAKLASATSQALAGTAGVVANLVIEQDETANYLGQTITVPGAIRIVSDTNVPSCGV